MCCNPSELMSFVCVCFHAVMEVECVLCVCLLADLDFSLSVEYTLRRSIRRARLHQIPRCHRTQSVRCVYREQNNKQNDSSLKGDERGLGVRECGCVSKVKSVAPSLGVKTPHGAQI